MSEQECVDLLSTHGIRPTANRIVVAKALAQAERPLSMSELEYRILSIDKSNIFRTLTLFHAHHLVHTIESGVEGVRYELCTASHDAEDDDQHVHFYCEQCHRTFCLPLQPIPQVPLPEGFRLNEVSYVLKGTCPDCARKHPQA